jgi:hypothetical protein
MERGAAAEEVVAEVLTQLGPEYCVLHDLDTGAGNVDHVIVGPSGVYTIETKSHGGTVSSRGGQLLINGRRPAKDFLAQAYAEAMAIRSYLSTALGESHDVKPLLVFTEARVKVPHVRGVAVLPCSLLLDHLKIGHQRLGSPGCTRIARALGSLVSAPAFLSGPPRRRRLLPELASRALPVLLLFVFSWWLFAGGGLALMLGLSADRTLGAEAEPAAVAAVSSPSVSLAKEHLRTYAPDYYPKVANIDSPRVTAGPDGTFDYTWEFVEQVGASEVRIRTVIVRTDHYGQWRGLSFGE